MKALRAVLFVLLAVMAGATLKSIVLDANAVPIKDPSDGYVRDFAGYPKWGATAKFTASVNSATSGALAAGFYRVHTNVKVWCDAILGAQNPGNTVTHDTGRPIVADLPEPLFIDGRTDTKLACM